MKEREWKGGKRRRSAEERERLMEEYRASGKTQKQFCEDKGVPLATLTLWLRKSRKEAKAPRLIEVSMPSVGDGMPAKQKGVRSCSLYFFLHSEISIQQRAS